MMVMMNLNLNVCHVYNPTFLSILTIAMYPKHRMKVRLKGRSRRRRRLRTIEKASK